MAKNKDILESNERLSEGIADLARSIRKNNDQTTKTNKSLVKTVAGIAQTNKILAVAKKSWTDAFTKQGDLVKMFTGFGRTFEITTNKFANIFTNNINTMNESFKAVNATYQAGITKNTQSVIDLNGKMLILGKDTKSLSKLIAVQNQVFRTDAKKSVSVITTLIESATQYGVNTDKMVQSMVGLQDQMKKLRFSMGSQFDMQLQKAFATISEKWGPEGAALWKSGMVDMLSNARKLQIATGGLQGHDLTTPEGLIRLGEAMGRHAGQVMGNMQQNLGGPMGKMLVAQNSQLMNQMGVNQDLYHFFQLSRGTPNAKLDDASLAARVAMNVRRDPLRTVQVLLKKFSGALIPIVASLGGILHGGAFPMLNQALLGLASTIYSVVEWVNSILPDSMKINMTRPPGLGGGGGGGGGPQSLARQAAKATQGSSDWGDVATDAMVAGGAYSTKLPIKLGSGAMKAYKAFTSKAFTSTTVGSAMQKSRKGFFKLATSESGEMLARTLGLKAGEEVAEDVFLKKLGTRGMSHLIGKEMLEASGRKSITKKLIQNSIKQAGTSTWRGIMARRAGVLAAKQWLRHQAATTGSLIFGPAAGGVATAANVALTVADIAQWGSLGMMAWDMYNLSDKPYAQAMAGLPLEETIGAQNQQLTKEDIRELAQVLENQGMGRWQDIADTITMNQTSWARQLKGASLGFKAVEVPGDYSEGRGGGGRPAMR